MKLLKLFYCSALLFATVHIKAQDWSLSKDKNDVKVYTRSVAGEALKEYKVITVLNCSKEQAIQNIMNWGNYVNWLDGCIEARLLKRIGDDESIGYYVVDAPWPVSDRDLIISLKRRIDGPKTYIDITALPTYMAEKDGLLRLKRFNGYWTIVDLGNGRVEVTQQMWADPGGSIPSWLANATVTDNPYNSFSNLKKQPCK